MEGSIKSKIKAKKGKIKKVQEIKGLKSKSPKKLASDAWTSHH